MRHIVLRHDDQPAGLLIQPVHDPRPQLSTHSRKLTPQSETAAHSPASRWLCSSARPSPREPSSPQPYRRPPDPHPRTPSVSGISSGVSIQRLRDAARLPSQSSSPPLSFCFDFASLAAHHHLPVLGDQQLHARPAHHPATPSQGTHPSRMPSAAASAVNERTPSSAPDLPSPGSPARPQVPRTPSAPDTAAPPAYSPVLRMLRTAIRPILSPARPCAQTATHRA